MRRLNILDAPMRYPPYTSTEQTIMGLVLQPQVGYYFSKIGHAITDKKNLAIAAMGAYIVRSHMRAKL